MNGLGDCGCCGETYDENERFAVALAYWCGKYFPQYTDRRSLVLTWTYSFAVKRYLRTSGANVYVSQTLWTVRRTDTVNKWTGEITEGTPTVITGTPPDAWDPDYDYTGAENRTEPVAIPSLVDYFEPPVDETNPLPTVAIRTWADNPWVAVDITSGQATNIMQYRWDWGPVVWKNIDLGGGSYHSYWTIADELADGDTLYIQICQLEKKWSLADGDCYLKSAFDSDWTALREELSFDVLETRKTANSDFHFATYHYNSDGHIVERYIVEKPKSGDYWNDKWIADGDGWAHDVGAYYISDDTPSPNFLDAEYTEIVNGGAESSAVACNWPRDWEWGAWFEPTLVDVPHSTLVEGQLYTPALEYNVETGSYEPTGPDGIPPVERFRLPDGTFWIAGLVDDPERSGAIERITIVPLLSSTETYSVRRYTLTQDDSRDINPTGCCYPFRNHGNKKIYCRVTGSVNFEHVLPEACDTWETLCQ